MLVGGAGLDFLIGGTGSDVLKGGSGGDRFYFNTTLNANTNVDTIVDFVHGVDYLVVDLTFFPGIVAGEIASGAFLAIGSATSASSHIIYKPGSGKLFFDPTGNVAGGDAVLFAKVDPGTTIDQGDFIFI